jgi:hypothetical protein
MQTWEIIAIAWAIVATVILGSLLLDRARSRRLRKRFGREYDRTISEVGDRRKAESDLTQREKRLEQLRIHPLSPIDRERFIGEWTDVQAVFVDDPARAVDRADELINTIMTAKGYTGYTVSERIENVFAAHPQVARHYQEACAILADHRNGRTSTENLRRAMVDYRELIHELLGEGREEYRRVS